MNFEWIKTLKIMYGLWVYSVKNLVWDQYALARTNPCTNSPGKFKPHLKVSWVSIPKFQSDHLCFVCFLHLRCLRIAGMTRQHKFKLHQDMCASTGTLCLIWSLVRDWIDTLPSQPCMTFCDILSKGGPGPLIIPMKPCWWSGQKLGLEGQTPCQKSSKHSLG
jgi:hypothetical protein